ncbi:MAG TPA: T9SS type A sorting domain-containing protein [Flavipsychrobacter sp.]
MKKRLFLLLAMFCSTSASAQSYRYNFFYGLGEKGSGPALVSQCTTGTYKIESLPVGTNRVVYNFEKGCGLVFNDSLTNLISSGSYTIEMYFKLDTVSGYKKIIDFNNLSGDHGFYNFGGKLNLYPNFTSTDSFMGAGTYQYVAITRNSSTKQMYLYHNNKVAGSYVDNSDQYKYGVNKKLIFFRDDNGTGGEHTSGAVGFILISNSAMDSNAIKGNYSSLASTLNISVTETHAPVSIYPNPANDYITILVPQNTGYVLCAVTSSIIQTGHLAEGSNNISLRDIPAGMYFVKIADNIQSIKAVNTI